MRYRSWIAIVLFSGMLSIVILSGAPVLSTSVTRSHSNYSLARGGTPVTAANTAYYRDDAVAQNTPSGESPMECEGAATRLDFAVIETKKIEGAYLIVVARLGKGELSSKLNRVRLAAAEEYILRRGAELKYVLAEGRPTGGLGRLELYVGGRLYEVMPFKKNARGYCVGPESE